MGQYCYQFHEVSVKIDGVTQSLVQSVAVKGDTGLDFVSIHNTGTEHVISKAKNITIDITSLSDGSFIYPQDCALFNSTGIIEIQRWSEDYSYRNIIFSGCLLAGTKSSISTDQFGEKTITYMSLGHTNIESGSFSSPPDETGRISDIGATRACYTGILESGQTAFESSCSINRELLYSPGIAPPTHICIKYPIETSSTVTRIPNSQTLKNYALKGSGVYDGCEGPEVAASGGIPSGYLENISLDGATVDGDIQQISYTYKSTYDYYESGLFSPGGFLNGLKRIIELK